MPVIHAIAPGREMHSDVGFGLAEVVVGMFVLAIISLSLLPSLVQGLTQSANNITLTAATQFANTQLDSAQAVGTTCSVVRNLGGTLSQVDSRGVTLVRTTVVTGVATPLTPCPTSATSYPTTVSVAVTVTRSDTGNSVASASTLVYVDAQ